MSDTTVTSTLTGAQDIAAGGTFDVSGTWTADYNAAGTLEAVSNVDITISGSFSPGGTPYDETFTSAVIVSNNGTYEIEPAVFVSADTNTPITDGAYDYGSVVYNEDNGTYYTGPTLTALYWAGETPTSLEPDSEIALGASPNEYAAPLTSDGAITNTNTYTIRGPGSIVSAGGAGADSTIIYAGSQTSAFDIASVLTVNSFGIGDSIIIDGADFPAGTPILSEHTFIGGTFFATEGFASGVYFIDVDVNTISGTPSFSITTDASGDVTLTAFCFYPGTNVRTPAGDVAVETLKSGDLVTLNDGRIAPISWLGRQTVSTKFADPLRVLPIRIKASALGESLPARDLLISPDHAILVNDILVQAGALVNGVSIVRETDVPKTFTYYHVEVADHSLVLAENIAAETFIDNVDRLKFDNWEEHEALESVAMTEMAYPRAKSARQVPQSIRARLLARGQALYGVEVAAAA